MAGLNRLRGLRTYIAGPIDRCPEGGVPWRREITPLLNKLGVVVLDPTDKPMSCGGEDFDHREERGEWKRRKQYDLFADCMKTIRRTDLRLIDVSDFMIAYVDTNIFAWGTVEEISLANRQKKPTLIWCRQGKEGAPDWLFGQIPHWHIFGTQDELLAYLRSVDCGKTQDSTGRWAFLKFDRLYDWNVLNPKVYTDNSQ